MLKILADENIAVEIATWLRTRGCDVLYAAETLVQETDVLLPQTAETQGRLLITEDKDFGELVSPFRLAPKRKN